MRQKKLSHLLGYGMKNVRPTWKIKMLIYQSKANLDEKSLFGKIAHYLSPEIRKMLVNGQFGNQDAKFHSGIRFSCYRK